MANGLTGPQQNELAKHISQKYGMGSGLAQNFVSGGNNSILGNLANQSNLGFSNNGGNGNALNNIYNNMVGTVKNTATQAANVATAALYDQLGNSTSRISASNINSFVNAIVRGFGDLATGNITALLNDVISDTGAMAATFLKDMAEVDTKLLETTNKSGAFVGELGKNMRSELHDAMVTAVGLGASVDDFLKSTETMLTSSGRMAMYSKEAMSEGVLASIAYTKSSTTLLENNESFRNVGYGIQDAAKAITAAGQRTLELGLNAKVLTETLVKDIGKLNEFGFQGGIKGLTKMAQEAQSLNFNIDNTFKIANDLFDPNKAIDMAANLSMIGGAIGDFGDPLRMIYDATNNVEGLQTSLINASKSLATYNAEQGRFEVTGANLRRAKMMADTFGISMSDLTNLAVKANVQFQAMSQIRLLKVTDDQKEFLKNISTMQDGKIGFYIPQDLQKKMDINSSDLKDGFLTMEKFQSLSVTKQSQLLEEQKNIAKLKPEEIARGQFNATTQILNVISAMYLQQQQNSRNSGIGKTIQQGAEGFANNLDRIKGKINEQKDLGSLFALVTNQAKKTLLENTVNSKTQNDINVLNKSANQNGPNDNTNNNQSSNNQTTNNQTQNQTQNVNVDMVVRASNSTMDAMVRHFSKNLQDLELIGVKINKNSNSFDSTRKVFTKK